MNPSPDINLALVGLGVIARAQHLPAIEATDGVTLTAIASRNAVLDGVASYPNIAALLDARPDVTAVSLATPPQGRFDQARAVLDAGRHLMLEKPPGATLSEIDALTDLAAARGLTVFATWHSRMAAGVDAARDWIAARDLAGIRITWREDVRKWHPGQDWIWQPGGLGVFDPGINALSILTDLVPGVVLRRADLTVPQGRATPIAADLDMQAGDTAISAQFDWRETGDEFWQIALTARDGSTALLDQGGARFVADGVDQAGENREYARLYARFRDLIAAGRSDVDLSPMRLVADAFLTGTTHETDAFYD
ncbi:Gfo/Idh/MocA family protein [Paracoccus sp. (in: a-proteobacteria)]|uniref:Gfo/Idh/MocA family protein n=1 Tax=Paracoccus sp. TaxID=267 RepID=UPI0026E034E3|nr:Gfo/Idh/MocA family oxidoreductase [Paracoccus sp. (in: a-proteobacteria)]MDO5648259.1 Gfo/Idh/MocA family oxidoreductase [Paracoccus sp. (in: a-proteobacteria)]